MQLMMRTLVLMKMIKTCNIDEDKQQFDTVPMIKITFMIEIINEFMTVLMTNIMIMKIINKFRTVPMMTIIMMIISNKLIMVRTTEDKNNKQGYDGSDDGDYDDKEQSVGNVDDYVDGYERKTLIVMLMTRQNNSPTV